MSSIEECIENAITWAENIANDDRYQYSQSNRWGQISKEFSPWYYDCSSFVAQAYTYSGYGEDFTRGYTLYTGNEYSWFTSHGFADVTGDNIVQRGDVLLIHIQGGRTHTCIYTGSAPVAFNAPNKETVQAIGRSWGIQAHYSDSSTYQYILRLGGTPHPEPTPPTPSGALPVWLMKKIIDNI